VNVVSVRTLVTAALIVLGIVALVAFLATIICNVDESRGPQASSSSTSPSWRSSV
jgi:hypothetical protein